MSSTNKFNRLEILAKQKGYVVLEDGTVNGPNKNDIGTINNGYVFINLRVAGKCRNVRAHRLQAYQKYGEAIYSKGIVVRHLDGNPLNNSHTNIAIGNNSDNMMDKPKEQRMKDALHATSFVRKHSHEEIISYHEKHNSYKKTMEKFNISSKGTLHFILKKSMANEG